MKKYLTFLLVPIFAVGLQACSQPKDQSMTSADKKSLSGNINTKDETSWSIDGKVERPKDKSKIGEEANKTSN